MSLSLISSSFLTSAGAPPEAITWVVPRDSWLINRLGTQNAPGFFHEAIGGQADQMQAFAEASSVDDLYARLEACGALRNLAANNNANKKAQTLELICTILL